MLSRIVSHSSVLRRPQASRLASSKGSSCFELQAGDAGLELWKAMAGGVVLVWVGCAALVLQIRMAAAGHRRQFDAIDRQFNAIGRLLDCSETGLNGLETRMSGLETRMSGLEKEMTTLVERLEKSLAAGVGELLRNSDKFRRDLQRSAAKDRRDLFHAIDRKAQVWGPTEAC